jgi:hypothetical protein
LRGSLRTEFQSDLHGTADPDFDQFDARASTDKSVLIERLGNGNIQEDNVELASKN